jgi:aspartate racemase
LPLISIVEATCDFAMKRKFTKLGLFGTRSRMQAGFYQQAFREQGIEILLPGIEEQNYINARYVGELIAGHFLPETREGLLAIVKKLKDDHGIEGLILGGTELPLLLRDDAAIGIPFLDTTRIHLQAALEYWQLPSYPQCEPISTGALNRVPGRHIHSEWSAKLT